MWRQLQNPLTCLSIQQSEKLLKQDLLNALPNFTTSWGMLHLLNQWLEDSSLGISTVVKFIAV